MIGLLIAALALPPVPAARVAAKLYDVPPAELVYITRRESSARWIGVHPRDASMSLVAWRNAVRVGWLRPAECAAHRYRDGQWHTRGAFGLSAAYNLRYLGTCAPPEALDVPLLAAIAAARKWRRICERPGKRNAWCGSYDG